MYGIQIVNIQIFISWVSAEIGIIQILESEFSNRFQRYFHRTTIVAGEETEQCAKK